MGGEDVGLRKDEGNLGKRSGGGLKQRRAQDGKVMDNSGRKTDAGRGEHEIKAPYSTSEQGEGGRRVGDGMR